MILEPIPEHGCGCAFTNSPPATTDRNIPTGSPDGRKGGGRRANNASPEADSRLVPCGSIAPNASVLVLERQEYNAMDGGREALANVIITFAAPKDSPAGHVVAVPHDLLRRAQRMLIRRTESGYGSWQQRRKVGPAPTSSVSRTRAATAISAGELAVRARGRQRIRRHARAAGRQPQALVWSHIHVL